MGNFIIITWKTAGYPIFWAGYLSGYPIFWAGYFAGYPFFGLAILLAIGKNFLEKGLRAYHGAL